MAKERARDHQEKHIGEPKWWNVNEEESFSVLFRFE